MTTERALVQSIRQRLENHARKSGLDIQRTLVRYALERLLHRLSLSAHRDRFILKGAMLFSVWEHAPFRATGDLDFLGHGPNTEEALIDAFREICDTAPEAPDGLTFDTAGISAAPLRLATDYTGVGLLGRVTLRTHRPSQRPNDEALRPYRPLTRFQQVSVVRLNDLNRDPER